MRKVIKRFIYSRVVWLLGVIGVLWVAIDLWYEAVSHGFTALRAFQVAIATLLAVVVFGAFLASRAWKKRQPCGPRDPRD